jgi:hypothetical protein
MTPQIPHQFTVAHDLLDLIDRVTSLQRDLRDPDSVEREIQILRAWRTELLAALARYEGNVTDLLGKLIPDEMDRQAIYRDHYTLPEGED